jgi:hypothetical protein
MYIRIPASNNRRTARTLGGEGRLGLGVSIGSELEGKVGVGVGIGVGVGVRVRVRVRVMVMVIASVRVGYLFRVFKMQTPDGETRSAFHCGRR